MGLRSSILEIICDHEGSLEIETISTWDESTRKDEKDRMLLDDILNITKLAAKIGPMRAEFEKRLQAVLLEELAKQSTRIRELQSIIDRQRPDRPKDVQWDNEVSIMEASHISSDAWLGPIPVGSSFRKGVVALMSRFAGIAEVNLLSVREGERVSKATLLADLENVLVALDSKLNNAERRKQEERAGHELHCKQLHDEIQHLKAEVSQANTELRTKDELLANRRIALGNSDDLAAARQQIQLLEKALQDATGARTRASVEACAGQYRRDQDLKLLRREVDLLRKEKAEWEKVGRSFQAQVKALKGELNGLCEIFTSNLSDVVADIMKVKIPVSPFVVPDAIQEYHGAANPPAPEPDDGLQVIHRTPAQSTLDAAKESKDETPA